MKRRIDRRTFIEVSAGTSVAAVTEGGVLGGGQVFRAHSAALGEIG